MKEKSKRDLTKQCISAAEELLELLPKGQRPVPYIVALYPEYLDESEKYKVYRFFEWGKPDEKILYIVKNLSANLKRSKTKKTA